MKINKEVLVKGLDFLLKGVKGSTVLDSLVLKAENGFLKLRFSSVEVSANTQFEIITDEKFCVGVEPSLFSSIVRRLGDFELKIEEDKNLLSLNDGESKFSIPILENIQFSDIEELQSGYFLINANAFKEIKENVLFATSQDVARPVFTGVFIEKKDDNLVAVATNTHRLVVNKLPLTGDTEFNSIIIPKGVFNFEFNSENLKLKVGKRLWIESEDCSQRIEYSIIDGSFPDYERVFPKDFTEVYTVDRKSLLDAIEKAMIVSFKENNVIKLELVEGSLNVLSSSNNGTFSSTVNISNIKTDKGDFKIALSGKYLKETLSKIKDDNIILNFSGSLSPMLILGEDSSEFYKNIITPVRV